MPGRRRLLRFLAIAGGATLAIAIGVAVWIETTIRSRWTAMEGRVASLRAELDSLPYTRPSLRGPATLGNAWDSYQQAVALEIRDDVTPLNELLEGKIDDPPQVADLLRKYAAGADHIRRGVRCNSFRIPGLNLVQLNQYVKYPDLTLGILKLRAQQLRRKGETLAAAEILLDIAQVGLDLGRNRDEPAQRAALEVLQFMSDELRDLLVSDRATSVELSEIGRQLEALDRNWLPFEPVYLNRILALGISCIDDGVEDYDLLPKSKPLVFRDARFLWSRRLMLIDAFEQYDRWNSRLRGCDALNRAQVETLLAAVREEALGSRNRLLSELLRQWPACFRGGLLDYNLERRTQVRLLRMVAHYRAGGEILMLEDPFGGTLRSRRDGEKLKLWSIGSDRVDDAGKGGWEPHTFDRSSALPPDIVVEVKR